VGLRPSGRTGPGASNHCVHGKDEVVETVLDWRPFKYVTTEQVKHDLVETVALEPHGAGTRVSTRLKLGFSMPPLLKRPLARYLIRSAKYKSPEQFEILARLVRAEAAAQ